jgi:hypothetical protein
MNNLAKGILICWKTGDEVLHIHPTTQANAMKYYLFACLVLDEIQIHL